MDFMSGVAIGVGATLGIVALAVWLIIVEGAR